MKNYRFLIAIAILITFFIHSGYSQDGPVYPTLIKTPVAFEITKPLRDNPVVEDKWFDVNEFYMNDHRDREINPNITPPDFSNMPADPGEQTKPGWLQTGKTTLQNFAGQNSGSYPPDANGAAGNNYYFQVVNTKYAIYNKTTGGIVAGPSNLNTIFNSSLPGAGCNDGDPIVLWDEHANKWFFAEFSLCGSNDYMLIAVSTSSDPTGSWYSWSFDVSDTPDYMKFGIWEDGYYMATNTSGGNDVYVFDRATMIAGGSSPTMIAFDNAWRPATFDGFHCILPLDNDGNWAPSGDPGQFITIADNGQGNPADQLWIYELDANWSSPSSSTFNRTQTIGVNSFSGNFNSSWNNIPQTGTSQKLDGLSTILMFRAQYRNFSGDERLVCAHAIAESSSEAAMRWYELQKTGSTWSIRQQGTYNPDNISRWNMSIAMNGQKEIGIGYSVSNASMYPGIRYIGQSTASNNAANSTLDMAETVIWNGAYYQTTYNRWGDYANISVDPSDDHTFWFTSEYVASSTHGTRIASFEFSTLSAPPVADFTASNTMPANSFTTVNFSDLSTGSPATYQWTFTPSSVTYVSGSSTSPSPSVRFSNPGAYTVSLYVQNGFGYDTETKTAYIHMGQPGLWDGSYSTDWNNTSNWVNELVPDGTTNVSITPAAMSWPVFSGNLSVGTDCNSINFGSGFTKITVTGDLTIQNGYNIIVDPAGSTRLEVGGDLNLYGNFTPGQSTVVMNGTSNSVISTLGGNQVFYSEGFEGANAWTLTGEFEIGSPIGLGGEHGNPDPTSAYAGNNVLGVDLTGLGTYLGDYEAGLTSKQYQAISPTINCSGFTGVSLNFQRWLGLERAQYDHGYIDISNNNGSTWTQIWTNTTATTIQENSWSSQSINISSYADNQSQVKIRFSVGATDASWQYCGWNIDELNLTGTGSGNVTLHNLTVDNTNAVVSTACDVAVANDLIIKPGARFTNGNGHLLSIAQNLSIQSDASGIGSYMDNGSTTVGGTNDLQLYLTSSNWHYVSSPVAGAESGVFNGIYLRSFIESTDSWSPNITALDDPLHIMQGYAAWVPGTNPMAVHFNGPLNNGPFSISVTNNGSLTDKGWNLVGNPYPSSLDWDGAGWTKTNVNNTIYYYSGNGGLPNYSYYIGASGEIPAVGSGNGTNEIPPMQGFFVHAGASGTLGVSNAARIHSGQSYYKNDKELPLIRIIATGNAKEDETVIRFVPEATAEFDGNFDAFKLFANEYPQVYSVTTGGTDLAVNSLPVVHDELIVPLSFVAPSNGAYTFLFEEIVGFEEDQLIYLEDILTEEIQEVTLNPEYAFSYESSVTDRFLLHFSNPLSIEESTELNPVLYGFNGIIYLQLKTEQHCTIEVYDMPGRKVAEEKALSMGLHRFDIPVNPGFYLVKASSGNYTVTRKVFLK
ncbi:MAG: PKD domain-containing protein [Bacteroidales bacterium]|nr:PKD domain-containing protein [Bacteroidales bacterium]